ncbi:M15 family metallopeptidase [Herbaspirillum rhizosphaerae]
MDILCVSLCDNPFQQFLLRSRMPNKPSFLTSTLFFCIVSLALPLFAHAEITPLTGEQCATMQQNKVLSTENPVKCERLMQVSFAYQDFEGRRHDDGRLVVLDVVAPQVQAIFNALLQRGFPLQKARSLEAYQGDDEASMSDNNTSAFNGRPMTGGSTWSKHAYGVAIDINPLQNPYISKDTDKQVVVLPPSARGQYQSRVPVRAGMAEEVRDIFFRHGFMIWGGNWKQPIDYQHFEIGSRDFIAHLLSLPLQQARREFSSYAATYATCMSDSAIANLAIRGKACAGKSKR